MRIVCCSDIHGQYQNLSVPDGDVFVFAGDFSGGRGSLHDLQVFDAFLSSLPHKHKVVIAGNHDFIFERDKDAKRYLTNVIYLEDSSCEIDGVKFYGSPYTPEFFNWAFNLRRGLPLELKWKQIPCDTNVLITHGPPYGILDEVWYQNQGCVELLGRIQQLSNLKLHCFGHIHPGFGQVKKGNVLFVNAAVCDDGNNLIHQPIVIDL